MEKKEVPAFLFKAVNNDLVIYEGTVKRVNTDIAVFCAGNGGGSARRLQVSVNEGEVRNNAVWLLEKDEAAAAAAFVRWIEAKEKEYREKLRKLGEIKSHMQAHADFIYT